MTDPILTAIAAALATKAATGLYDLVRRRFSRHPERARALEAAAGAAPDSAPAQALADALAATEREDPGFAEELRAEWVKIEQTDRSGGVRNVVSGNVTGNVIQVDGNVSGGINLR